MKVVIFLDLFTYVDDWTIFKNGQPEKFQQIFFYRKKLSLGNPYNFELFEGNFQR